MRTRLSNMFDRRIRLALTKHKLVDGKWVPTPGERVRGDAVEERLKPENVPPPSGHKTWRDCFLRDSFKDFQGASDEQKAVMMDAALRGDFRIDLLYLTNFPDKYMDRLANKTMESIDSGDAPWNVRVIMDSCIYARISEKNRDKLIAKFKAAYGGNEIYEDLSRLTSECKTRLSREIASHVLFYDKTVADKPQYFEAAMRKGWMASSRSIAAQAYQQAVKEELGSQSPLWFNKAYGVDQRDMDAIPKETKENLRAVVKDYYKNTGEYIQKILGMAEAGKVKQGSLEQKIAQRINKEKGTISLYRGVNAPVSVNCPLASWTLDTRTAKMFDDHAVMNQEVAIEDVLVCVGAPDWKEKDDELEFIVISR